MRCVSNDESLARRADAARSAARDLDAAGGIVGQVDIAERWGVAESTVREHVARPDFPAVYANIGSRPVWLAAEIDLWRSRRPRAGR
jgi:predicted DNA-binding transcriptional regulator AlpA